MALSHHPRQAETWGRDTAYDGPTFIAYVEQVLVPTLKRGDVVFMDNLRTHKVEGRDGVIAELKEDRNFLREEVREARRSRDDVRNIAERMLDTLKTIAIGRLAAPQPSPSDPIRATFTEQ